MVDPGVLRRFSAGAARYEAHAHAQRLSAVDLLAYTEASLGPARRTGGRVQDTRAGLRDGALHADAPRRLPRRVRVRGGHLGGDGARREAGDRRPAGPLRRGRRGGDRHGELRPRHLQRRLPMVSLPSPHAGADGVPPPGRRAAHLLLLRPGDVRGAGRRLARVGAPAGGARRGAGRRRRVPLPGRDLRRAFRRVSAVGRRRAAVPSGISDPGGPVAEHPVHGDARGRVRGSRGAPGSSRGSRRRTGSGTAGSRRRTRSSFAGA